MVLEMYVRVRSTQNLTVSSYETLSESFFEGRQTSTTFHSKRWMIRMYPFRCEESPVENLYVKRREGNLIVKIESGQDKSKGG